MTPLRVATLGFLLFLAVSRSQAQGIIKQVLDSGPTDKRINMVFLSEGYLSSQQDQYSNDVQRVLGGVIKTPPLNAYSNYFNAFSIFVASAEQGSDHPSSNIYRDTYFNSTYDSYGITRLITIPPNDHNGNYADGQGKVVQLLRQLMPEYDLVLLIVNDTQYGGSGGSTLIASVNSASAEIAIHEMGHTFAGLGDEYTSAYPGFPDTEEPNTTRETDPALIKWRDWILPGTPTPTPATTTYADLVGLFEGAHYHTTGWYRPQLDCKMNHLNVPFCAVCAETLVKTSYGLVRPIESSSPSTNDVIILSDSQPLTLEVTPMQPAFSSLDVQWFTNDVPVTGATSPSLIISAGDLAPGRTAVRVEVTDSTAIVRTDPFAILKDTRTWEVEAPARPALEVQRAQDRVILSWPSAFPDFVLESTTRLDPGTIWLPTAEVPTVVNDRFTVTNLVTGASSFYRLRK
jgi:hypothetical protein